MVSINNAKEVKWWRGNVALSFRSGNPLPPEPQEMLL